MKRNRYGIQVLRRTEEVVSFSLEVNEVPTGNLVMETIAYRQFCRDLADGTGRTPDFVLADDGRWAMGDRRDPPNVHRPSPIVCSLCDGGGEAPDPFADGALVTCPRCYGTGDGP